MGNVKREWGLLGGWVAGGCGVAGRWCSGQQLPTGAPVARNSALGGKILGLRLRVAQTLWLSNFINTFIIPRHSTAQVAPEDGNRSGDPHFPPAILPLSPLSTASSAFPTAAACCCLQISYFPARGHFHIGRRVSCMEAN